MGKSKKKTTEKPEFSRWFLREWRKDRKLTLDQLADLVGTTGATISRMERGKQPYSQPMLEALAAALGCHQSDLLKRAPGPADRILAVLNDMSPDGQKRALAVVQALKEGEKA